MRRIVMQFSDEERASFIRKHEAEWKSTGSQIRYIRKRLRISQKRLAKTAGICVNTLRKLESGRYITRFKTVSASCMNSLLAIAYGDLVTIKREQ